MIDRETLKKAGFILINDGGWKDEAWFYEEANFFVFYGDKDSAGNYVNGEVATIPQMIQEIVKGLNIEWGERVTEAFRGDEW